MASKNKLLLERITTNEDIHGGAAIIRTTSIRVVDILQKLAKGQTIDHILTENPGLHPDDISACLLYNSGAK